MRDWIGNSISSYATLGASNHSEKEREQDDYYATDPKAIDYLLEHETFTPYIWECACGQGHLSNALIKHGYKVKSTDIVNRGVRKTSRLWTF